MPEILRKSWLAHDVGEIYTARAIHTPQRVQSWFAPLLYARIKDSQIESILGWHIAQFID